MNDDVFEITFDKYSAKLPGGRPINQVLQYFADAVGLIGEPLGMAKDKLSHYRMQRAEAAAIAMRRAIDIKEARGERIEPITPKLLTNWIEGVSMEDAESENILELWARLLADGGALFDSELQAHIDLLKKIGPKEAEAVDRMFKIRLSKGVIGEPGGAMRYIMDIDSVELQNNAVFKMLEMVIDRHLALAPDVERVDLNRISRLISKLIQGSVFSVRYQKGRSGKGFGKFDSTYIILEHAGLVSNRRFKRSVGDCELELKWAAPTPICISLFARLNREKLTIPSSVNINDVFLQAKFSRYLGMPSRLREYLNVSSDTTHPSSAPQ